MVTKQAIFEAANRLMMKKNIDRITVKDIAEECQITRQTFYYHFQDIQAMLEWGIENEMEKLLIKGRNAETLNGALLCYCQTILERKPLWKKLSYSRYNQYVILLMREQLKQYILLSTQYRARREEKSVKDMMFLLDYHTGAIFDKLAEWLREKEFVDLEYEVLQISRILSGELNW